MIACPSGHGPSARPDPVFQHLVRQTDLGPQPDPPDLLDRAYAAMQAICRVLKGGGKDVHWLLSQLSREDKPAPAPWVFAPAAPPWRDMVKFLSDDVAMLMLSERELEFIVSMKRRSYHQYSPSPRQYGWLTAIYQRVKLARPNG